MQDSFLTSMHMRSIIGDIRNANARFMRADRKRGSAMNTCETCRYSGHQQKRCMAPEGLPRYAGMDGCPMYAMSARAFMERVINANRRIRNMQQQAQRYRDMAMRSTSTMQAVRTGGTDARSKVEDGTCAFMDISRDIEEQARQLREIIRQTSEIIGRLSDPVEREVLELRYLSGLRWEDIGRRMIYDERQVRRIHVKALEHVQREMDCAEFAICRPGWNPGGMAPTGQAPTYFS